MTRRVYTSGDFGAPQIDGTKANHPLLSVLDAVLVNGYGDQVITSITSAGTTATATTTNPHGIETEVCRYTISGADQPEYNGEFVVTVTGASTFTYEMTGTAVTPATATTTIDGRKSGGTWTIPFQSADQRMYTMGGGSGKTLHVDDGSLTTGVAIVAGYDTVDSVNSGLGKFPINSATPVANSYFMQWANSTSTTIRTWVAVVDDDIVYIWLNQQAHTNATLNLNSTQYAGLYAFGDFQPLYPSITDTCFISSSNSSTVSNNTTNFFYSLKTSITGGRTLQFGSDGTPSTPMAMVSENQDYDTNLSFNNVPYPHPFTGGLHVGRILVGDTAASTTFTPMGTLKGILNPLHLKPFDQLTVIEGTDAFAGRYFAAVRIYSAGATPLLEII